MDSKKIVSIFSFLVLFHELNARTLDSGSPLLSPSPSPAPGPSNARLLDFGSPPPSPSPSPAPGPGPSNEGCWLLSTSCHNGNLTACIDPSPVTTKELLLFVKNDGDKPLNVTVTISFSRAKPKHIHNHKEPIPGHQIEKVDITASIRGNISIRVDAENFKCVIHIASGGGIFDIPFRNPTNGAYLLFLTGLIIIGIITWARCKRGKEGDGIPYQGLEMAQPDSPPANGWEQDWDGDWEEVGHQLATDGSAGNGGLASRSPRRNGRKNNWDD